MGTRCADHVTPLYPQKLALTSPTGGGRSVGIVRSRTKATEFSFSFSFSCLYSWLITHVFCYFTQWRVNLAGILTSVCSGIHYEFLFLGDLCNAFNKRQSIWGQSVTLKTFNPDRHASNLGLEDLWSLSQSLSASSRMIILVQLFPRSSPTTPFLMHYLVIIL